MPGVRVLKRTTLQRRTRLRPIGKRGQSDRDALEAIRPLVLARDGHRCRRCLASRGVKLDLHHLLSRAQGGGHTLSNVLCLCRRCHDAVTDRRAPDWREWVETRKAVRS